MAKTLKEQTAWYRSTEDRSWKRKFQFAEMLVVALSAMVGLTTFALFPEAKRFSELVYMFGVGLLVSSLVMARELLAESTHSRFFRSLLVFGFICGVGAFLGFVFVLLVSSSNAT